MSYLPLSFIQGAGSLVGIIAMKFSKRAGKRLQDNLLATKICDETNIQSMAKDTAREFGKTLTESMFIAWQRSKSDVAKLVLEEKNIDLVIAAAKADKPIVFLTPHIGNFEIAVKSFANTIKTRLTILYKPTKNKVFNQIMLNGRREDNINPVPTNKSGVMSIIRALKAREMVGILPDSVASSGDGVWVDFLGKKVFATTLAAKMVLFEDAVAFVVASYRVKGGFKVEYTPYTPTSNNIHEIVQELYKIFEQLVLVAPTQYYWSYDRFRIPGNSKSKN